MKASELHRTGYQIGVDKLVLVDSRLAWWLRYAKCWRLFSRFRISQEISHNALPTRPDIATPGGSAFASKIGTDFDAGRVRTGAIRGGWGWDVMTVHGNSWMLLCVKSFKSCKWRETSKWYRFMVHVWIEGGCFATCILFLECLVKGWKVMPVSVYKMSDGREVSPDFLNGPLCDVQPEAIHCFCFSCFMVKLHLTFHSLMQFNHFNELPSCLPQIPRPKDPQKEALAIYKRYEDELLSEAWYQDGKAFRISSPKDSTLVMSLSPCFLNLFAAKKQQNESDRMAVYDDSL